MPRSVLHMLPVVVLVCAATTPSAAAEECRGIRVAGDAIWSDALTQQLRANGAPMADDSRCAAVDVRCEARGAGLLLVLRDSQGRKAQRVIDDAATAAVWVETWLATAHLEPEPEPEPEPPVAPAPPKPEPVAATSPKPPAPPPKPDAPSTVAASATPAPTTMDREPIFSVGVMTDFMLDKKPDVLGGGLRIAGCGRIGPVCLGGSFRLGLSHEVGHHKRRDDDDDERDQPQLNKGGWSGALALTLEKGWTVGPVRLIPGLSLGVRLDQVHYEQRSDLIYLKPPDLVDEVWNFEAGAAFRVLVPVDDSWAVDLGIHFGIAPFDSKGRSSRRLQEAPLWTLAVGAGFRFGAQ